MRTEDSVRGEVVSLVRTLLVINATLDPTIEQAIAAGRSPRKDFLELQRALGADVIDLSALDGQSWTRLMRRLLGAGVAQALLAWIVSARYDAVFADRETTGLLLAALSRLRRRRPRLVMIGHQLAPPKKQALFRALRLHRAIDCVIVHSSLQRRIARDTLGLEPEHVAMLPYQTDERFWRPRDVPLKNQIVSVGNEYRDYTTLLEAVAGLDLDVTIVASSHWSKHRTVAGADLPPRVRLASYLDYEALRRLYAESLFVVVPLYDVEYQAGITAILEAMAMGKAIIVSHARGQTDVVRDRRRHNRSDPQRPSQSDWLQTLRVDDSIAQGQTGLYVMPGDPVELRRAISFLMAHPEHAREMGANGRRVVESAMSLDHFTERMSALIRGDHGIDPASGRPTEEVEMPQPALFKG